MSLSQSLSSSWNSLKFTFKCYFGANFYEYFIFLTRSLARLFLSLCSLYKWKRVLFCYTIKKNKEQSQIVNVTKVIDCLFFQTEVQWFRVNVEVLLHTLYFIIWMSCARGNFAYKYFQTVMKLHVKWLFFSLFSQSITSWFFFWKLLRNARSLVYSVLLNNNNNNIWNGIFFSTATKQESE